MIEVWKDIIGYEGLYQVSNHGRVKSLYREFWSGKGYRAIYGQLNTCRGYKWKYKD